MDEIETFSSIIENAEKSSLPLGLDFPRNTLAQIEILDKSPGFEGLLKDVRENCSDWKAWCVTELPERQKLPTAFGGGLSLFAKYIMLSKIRPDRLIAGADVYCSRYLKELHPTGIENVIRFVRDVPNVMPILIGVSCIFDAETFFDTLIKSNQHTGEENDITKQLVVLCSQNIDYIQCVIEHAARKGNWLIISINFISSEQTPVLNKLLRSISCIQYQKNFRLFLLYSTDIIDTTLLPTGLRMINYANPSQLRESIINCYRLLPENIVCKYVSSVDQLAKAWYQ